MKTEVPYSVIDEQAKLNAKVVAHRAGHAYTLGELHRYFNMVCDLNNWKLPIDKVALLQTERDVYGMHEAVVWFTGSVPHLAVNRFTPEGIEYRVTAAGYYAAIGA